MPRESTLLPPDDGEPEKLGDLSGRASEYVVVARRYRPQRFDELIGQEHVARALEAAIVSGRIGHAFLFTGARGTGKTSTARILAKALNCVQGPTPRPCNECDICKSISTGDDVDALEIDGASNNGIDQIRELRQNANIRPSRSRFKIYIIDEVHMLSPAAFNGLLKTLEEPPEHVKFVFCTTEAQKIPATILSRCQRFDFAGVEMSAIAKRLRQICEAEGVEAEPEALMLLARRAAGSMRDSQSLLEQLLAFGNQRITVADVHEMLGTAGAARLSQIVKHLAGRDAAAALADLDAAVREGVDVSQLLDQLLGYFRDLMVSVAGCPPDTLLYSSPGEHTELVDLGRQLGLETILAMMQILDQTIARLRYSMHPRALAELAFVRICTLANLETIPALVAQLRGGATRVFAPDSVGGRAPTPASPAPLKKKSDQLASDASALQKPPTEPTGDDIQRAWAIALDGIGGMLAEWARPATLAARAGGSTGAQQQVVATFAPQYNFGKQFCERPENLAQLEGQLGDVLGRKVKLALATSEANHSPPSPHIPTRAASPRQRMSDKAEHPWVKRAVELFDARVVWMDEGGARQPK
jgi:DNA polymerase-3 subunit gamma/tau